jgi:hypothetical protein
MFEVGGWALGQGWMGEEVDNMVWSRRTENVFRGGGRDYVYGNHGN